MVDPKLVEKTRLDIRNAVRDIPLQGLLVLRLNEILDNILTALEEAEAKAGPTREEIRVAVHWAVGHAMGEKSGPTMNNKFRSVHQITKEAMRRLFPTAPVDEENNDDS